MGRKLLIMPPYQPVEYKGDMGREIERRGDMYRDADMRYPDWRTEMRAAPYRGSGGYNDRAGVMTYGGDMGRDTGYSRVREPEMTWPYYGYEDDMEMRRGRDSRGRYTSVRSAYEPEMARRRRSDGTYMRYDSREVEDRYLPPYGEPMYDREREESTPKMHRIGFSVGGEMERLPEIGHEYKTDATYRTGDEMANKTATAQKGYGMGEEVMPLTKETAMEWMQSLENADNTHGPHWNMNQTNTVMAQYKLQGDPLEWYVVLNMMYSDYCAVAKKLNVNNLDFYVCMAKAFLNDQDSIGDKLSAYYTYVVRH